MIWQIIRYRVLTMPVSCLALLIGLAGCGGGGGNAPGEPPPSITPSQLPPSTVRVTGRAHAGTLARPLALAPCRFVAQHDEQPLAEATTNQVGAFELSIPLNQQGFILCHPAAMPSLELSAFISSVGQTAGGHLENENVTPTSSVIADVIRANDPIDPQARKRELLAALAREEIEITTLVEAATLLYQTVSNDQIDSGVDFSGISAESDGAEADGGGVDGEAGDGGEFSPLPGALCTFSLDMAGLVRTNTLVADLYADGHLDHLNLQAVAPSINNAIDAERRRAITQAFAALFPMGIGPSLATIADGDDSMTPGRYFLPIPAGVPGVVTCIPERLDNLMLRTCVRARAPQEVINAEDVTPISTLVCEIAYDTQQAGTAMDRDTTKVDLYSRLTPLRIFLSEDRNGNGVQDADERDKNGDGEFATLVELASDEPLTENNRQLALLASMWTTIFDTLRIEMDSLASNASFEVARQDFFSDAAFEAPFEPIASGVESALNDPANQEVLGTNDVVTAARTGTLQGRVTDVRGRAVGDVRVVASQGDIEVEVPDNPAITDSDGRFQIRNIPVGDTTVRAFLDEFEVLRVTTKVVAVVTVDLEIAPAAKLEPRPSALEFGDVKVGARRILKVRLTNNGSADLTLDGLVIEGTGAAAFRFERRPVLPVVVSDGSGVTVAIAYEPTEVSDDLATLRVESDAQNTPVLELPLVGTAVEQPVPQIELSLTRFDFGEVQLNTLKTQSMVVRNSGTAPLTIHAVTLEAAATSGFAIEPLPALPALLPPGDELALDVRFQPTQTGVSRGTLHIQSDVDDMPSRTVPLRGTGIEAPLPEITADPRVIEFGETQINVPGEALQSVTQTVTLRNIGTANVTLTAIRVDSSQGDEFRLAHPPALPLTMIPGAELTLDVQYQPTILGSVTGAVRIRSDAKNLDDLTIALSGTGVDMRVAGAQLTMSPSPMSFGEVPVGTVATQTLSIANDGNADLNVTGLTVQGDANNVFRLGGNQQVSFTVAPGEAQMVDIVFAPTTVGSINGTVSVQSNASNAPAIVSLSGTGTAPAISVAPASVDFGGVVLEQSVVRKVTITNEGTVALDISSVTAVGAAFAVSGVPAGVTTLRPGKLLEVDVTFTPVELGAANGSLQILSNASTSPMQVPLSGNGLPISAVIEVTPPRLTFGEVSVGSDATMDFTIRNLSNAVLAVTVALSSTAGDGVFALDNAPIEIASSGEATVTVRFSPLVVGDVNATVQITSNAEPEVITVEVTGTGEGTAELPAAQLVVEPTAIAFDEVAINDTKTRDLTLRNEGSLSLTVDAITLTAGGDAGFAIVNGPSAAFEIVPDGGKFTVMVALTPVAAGELAGNLQITSNSVDGLLTDVPLSGVGMAQSIALISVEPADEVDFGNVKLGQTRMASLTLSNNGDADLTIDHIAVSKGGDRGFAIDGGPIENVVLAPGDPLEVMVTLTPEVVGPLSGLLEVQSNADNEPVVKRPLIGTGMAIPVPVVTVTPDQVNFGEVNVGDQVTDEVQIKNTGDADLTVMDVLIAQGAASGFGVTGVPDVPTVLAPGEVLTVTAVFAPAASGPVTGTLSVLSDASNGAEQRVSLQATGTGVSAWTVTPSSIDFGNITVGNSGRAEIRIKNIGTAPLNVDAPVIRGNTGEFTVDDGTAGPFTLEPDKDTEIIVSFTPSQAGEANATLAIHSNAEETPNATIGLRGEGVAGP